MGNFGLQRKGARAPRRPRGRASTKTLLPALLTVGALLVMLAPPAVADHLPDGAGHPGTLFRPAVQSSRGVVASTSNLASEAGLAVLEDGGNAMDAAVATVFAVGVTRPDMCGIGGGGFLVYRGADGEVAALDFRETAPVGYQGSRGMKIANRTVEFTGHDVVGVPGTVAGMAEALRRFGTIDLATAVAPAEELARKGFPVHQDMQISYGLHTHRLLLFKEAASIYLIGGIAPYPTGALLVQRDYAASLRLIASEGEDAFYRGAIAEMIVRDMANRANEYEVVAYEGDGGVMTLADLASYRAVWRTPLHTTYRGYEVLGMPEPTSGGIAVIEGLNILEHFDLRSFGSSSADYLHVVSEALKVAFADRAQHVGDSDFYPVPNATLTSKAYAAGRSKDIDMAVAKGYNASDGSEGGDTTHVSVIDEAGNAVAITCSIEQGFGSAVVAPGTGFLLNNELTDFNNPSAPNPSDRTPPNNPEPGKRPRSSMSPTIVVRDGKAVLAIGAAGGPLIIPAVLQTIINQLDFGMDVAEALDAERIVSVANRAAPFGAGSSNYPRTTDIALEDVRVGLPVQLDLRSRSHGWDSNGEYNVLAARVQAAARDLAIPGFSAASDTRREGGSAAANELPVAAGNSSSTQVDRVRPVHFTDLSSDKDGRIVAWLWDFGDGKTSGDRNPSHLYKQLGTFDVTLTVTDNHVNNFSACCKRGASVSAHIATITVKNIPPASDFQGQGQGSGANGPVSDIEANRVDAVPFSDASSDPDGAIVAWAWDFGDGATSGARHSSHQYTQLGTYVATLTVTDNDGATGTASARVRVVNLPPVGAISDLGAAGNGLQGVEWEANRVDPVQFQDASSDRDGGIAAWLWDFGDGVSSAERDPAHQYTALGTFALRLRVTDSDGAAAEASGTVRVVNLLPWAEFSHWRAYPNVLEPVKFTNQSTDRDGTIVALRWDFGDGHTSAEADPWHVFLRGGFHTVSLRVEDNDGGAATLARSLYVCNPTGEYDALADPQHVHVEFEACLRLDGGDLPLLPMGAGVTGGLPGAAWLLTVLGTLVARRVRR